MNSKPFVLINLIIVQRPKKRAVWSYVLSNQPCMNSKPFVLMNLIIVYRPKKRAVWPYVLSNQPSMNSKSVQQQYKYHYPHYIISLRVSYTSFRCTCRVLLTPPTSVSMIVKQYHSTSMILCMIVLRSIILILLISVRKCIVV